MYKEYTLFKCIKMIERIKEVNYCFRSFPENFAVIVILEIICCAVILYYSDEFEIPTGFELPLLLVIGVIFFFIYNAIYL